MIFLVGAGPCACPVGVVHPVGLPRTKGRRKALPLQSYPNLGGRDQLDDLDFDLDAIGDRTRRRWDKANRGVENA